MPKQVLIIGIEPTLLDFSSPAMAAFPGLTAAKIMAGLQGDQQLLQSLGYEVQFCLTDLGQTAPAQVREKLASQRFDAVLIGAGIRVVPEHFLLFEQVINIVHQHAPQAKICFNTKPKDTAAAVQRWL